MRSMLAFAVATAFAVGALAQPARPDEDHTAHHPAAASAPAAPVRPAASPAPSPAQMDAMMKSMQEMHDRMKAATTPQERQALMAEHRKTVREGMAMMGRMKPGPGRMGMGAMDGAGPSMHHEMMSRRMDMMEMMMQMMLDREAAGTPPAK